MLTNQTSYQRPMLVTDWNKTSSPSNLISTLDNGELVISSVDLAIGLGINHKSLIETIRKYLPDVMQFGQSPFKTAPVKNSVGAVNDTTIALLNENQALLISALSRNTVQVVAFKVTLVREFDKARKAINELFRKEPKTEGLVQLVNDLTDTMIGLEKKLDRLSKSREKFYTAKVVEKQKEKDDEDKVQYEAARDKWRIKFLQYLDRYCKYANSWPDRVFPEVYERFEKEYGVRLVGQPKRVGESALDVAYRLGYGQQIWEVLAYRMLHSCMVQTAQPAA